MTSQLILRAKNKVKKTSLPLAASAQVLDVDSSWSLPRVWFLSWVLIAPALWGWWAGVVLVLGGGVAVPVRVYIDLSVSLVPEHSWSFLRIRVSSSFHTKHSSLGSLQRHGKEQMELGVWLWGYGVGVGSSHLWSCQWLGECIVKPGNRGGLGLGVPGPSSQQRLQWLHALASSVLVTLPGCLLGWWQGQAGSLLFSCF